MDKGEVLEKLSQLTTQHEGLVEQQIIVKAEVAEKDKTRGALKQAYEEVKKRFQAAEDAFMQRRDDLKSIEREGKQVKGEIESLQRELARILDSERVHEEYKQLVNTFRDSSLNATWRKENREDGLGAFDYQIDGAIHLAAAKRALLGDKRGLGKSLTSLIWADLLESEKTIIICPSDTQDNYIREINRWTPHRAPIKIGQMPKGQRDFILRSLQHSPVFTVILNFEAWRRDPTLIEDLIALKADTLIVDEAHYAKDMRTLVARGIRDLAFGANICPSCGYPRVSVDEDIPWMGQCACGFEANIGEFCSIKNYLPMTGTPILNKPEELFPHLHIIDPELFPDVDKFRKDFTVKLSNQRTIWRFGAEDKLMEKIGKRYLARDRKTAGIVIPPNASVEHIITMDEMAESHPKQFKAYQQAREYAQIILDPDNKTTMSFPNFVTLLMRLRQVLVWPNAIKLDVRDPDTDEFLFTQHLNVTESIKLDKAERLIKEIIEEGERVVLFSQFNPGLHILQERLGKRSVVYDGHASRSLRNAIQLDFDGTIDNPSPKWDVLLGIYKSGGTGLNFTGASHEIQLDREWNPGRQDQAIGRIDRIGQSRDTETHHIIVEDSVDTWMKRLIEEKEAMTEGFEDTAKLYQKTYEALRNGEI